MSFHPFTIYIFITVYTKFCQCTANCLFQPFPFLRNRVPRSLDLNVLALMETWGLLFCQKVADVHSTFPKSLVPVKNNRPRTRFPTIIITKEFQCVCGHPVTICTYFYDHSLLEMLHERAILINSAASHVKSNSHCERTACVTTSIFGMQVTSCVVSRKYQAIFHNH